jgi:GNAT superfamily N-acetyltransferase
MENFPSISTVSGPPKNMITIRKYQTGDEIILRNILHRNFDEVNSKDYPIEAIHSLKDSFSLESIILNSRQREIFVALKEEQIIGTGSLGKFGDDYYALTVFVNPDFHKQGIGRKLMTIIEQKAKEYGAYRLIVPASITGELFYLKMGYDYLSGERKIDEDMNIKMVKSISL